MIQVINNTMFCSYLNSLKQNGLLPDSCGLYFFFYFSMFGGCRSECILYSNSIFAQHIVIESYPYKQSFILVLHPHWSLSLKVCCHSSWYKNKGWNAQYHSVVVFICSPAAPIALDDDFLWAYFEIRKFWPHIW